MREETELVEEKETRKRDVAEKGEMMHIHAQKLIMNATEWVVFHISSILEARSAGI